MRGVLAGGGTCIVGIIEHLAEAERYWFGRHLAGAAWDGEQEHGMTVPAHRAAADVLASYQAAIEDSRRAVHAAASPQARFAAPAAGDRHTLRWGMAHMTSKTARHAGHAGILRERALPAATPGGGQPLAGSRRAPPV